MYDKFLDEKDNQFDWALLKREWNWIVWLYEKNDELDHTLAHFSVLYTDQNDIDYVKMQDTI